MTFQLNDGAVARVAAMPQVAAAAREGARLVALWPLTDATRMENDEKYAEDLQVRLTREFAEVMTGGDVTMPDAEFVYEGADVIPGRPQDIVDALLAANDAYDAMADFSESGEADAPASPSAAGAADGDAAEPKPTDGQVAALATRFATALVVCDALLAASADHASAADEGGDLVTAASRAALPIVLMVNELRERLAVPRIFFAADELRDLMRRRLEAADADARLTVTAGLVAPLAGAEWAHHREQVLWDPDEAKKRAKEEDEAKSKAALAAKFAHVKDDPSKPHVEL